MHRLEALPLNGINNTQLDTPKVFEVRHGAQELTYEHVISHTPAVTTEYDALDEPQLVLADVALEPWSEDAHYSVGRLAPFHGRNIEVLADRVAIKDKYGNRFGSLCIKGCDFSDPHFMPSPTAQRDHVVNGLQESLVMERVLRASQLLRKKGIGTEYILGLSQPLTFPVPDSANQIAGRLMDLPEFLDTMAGRYAVEQVDEEGKTPVEALAIKTELIDRFKDCDYLISFRAMDAPFRLGEIADLDQFEALREFLFEQPLRKRAKRFIKKATPDSFVERVAAPMFGENLGKMHKLGVAHKFLHSNNISALGSIVDLDSVYGAPLGLGDAEVDADGYITDVSQAIRSIMDVFNDMSDYDTAEEIRDSLIDARIVAITNFLCEYAAARFIDQSERDDFFADMFRHTNYSAAFHSLSRTKTEVSWAIVAAYNHLGLPSDDKDTALELFDIPFEEYFATQGYSGSYLLGISPKFYSENADYILDMKPLSYGEDAHEDTREIGGSTDAIHFAFRAVAIEILCRAHTDEQKVGSHAFMNTMLALMEDPSSENAEVQHRFTGLRARLLQLLQQPRLQDVSAALVDDVSPEQVGAGPAPGEIEDGNGPFPIWYLDSGQYEALAQSLEEEINGMIKIGGQDALDMFIENPNHFHIYADVAQQAALSEQYTLNNTVFNTAVFQGWEMEGVRPMIAVHIKDDDVVDVYLYSSDSAVRERRGETITYEEFLRLTSPGKVAKNNGHPERLFA
jgi:hypothetical protein